MFNKTRRNQKLLIFDFDGTMADTKALYYGSIHKWLKKEKVHFTEKEFQKVFGLKLVEILKKFKIKKDAAKIKKEIHKEVFRNINKIKLSEDVKYIKELYMKKIIISNTMTKYIKAILIRKGLIRQFKEIYGGENFIHKEDFIKKYIKNKKLNKKEVFYIGDMVKDVEIARKVGCVSVAISHKFSWSGRQELLEAKPDFILGSFKELPKIINDS